MLQKHTDREETLTRIPRQKHKNINTRRPINSIVLQDRERKY